MALQLPTVCESSIEIDIKGIAGGIRKHDDKPKYADKAIDFATTTHTVVRITLKWSF